MTTTTKVKYTISEDLSSLRQRPRHRRGYQRNSQFSDEVLTARKQRSSFDKTQDTNDDSGSLTYSIESNIGSFSSFGSGSDFLFGEIIRFRDLDDNVDLANHLRKIDEAPSHSQSKNAKETCNISPSRKYLQCVKNN